MGFFLVLLNENVHMKSLRNDLAFLGMFWDWEGRPCGSSFFRIIEMKIFLKLGCNTKKKYPHTLTWDFYK